MADKAAKAEMLHLLLPDGGPFDGPDLYALLRALSGAPASVDTAAEQHLEDFLPDTAGSTGAYLDDWARVLGLPEANTEATWDALTDAQKATEIRLKLQGRSDPNFANFETLLDAIFGDAAGDALSQEDRAAFMCNVGACGDACGAYYSAVWSWRYMDNTLDAPPDDFTDIDWDAGTVTANAHYSPITETLIADQLGGVAGTTYGTTASYKAAACTISGTADDDTVRCTVWLRSVAANPHKAYLYIRERDGTTYSASTEFQIKDNLWTKCSIRREVGSGASKPLLVIAWVSADGDIYASQAMAGVADPVGEARAVALAPLHTVGEFLLEGEDQ